VTSAVVSAAVFYLLAALTLGGAAWVAFSSNIVHSAFALFATLFGVAGLYAYLSADLLAVVQLLVYVGGISVLVLFAVMLTSGLNQAGTSNPSARRVGGAVILLLVAAGSGLCASAFPLGVESVAAPTTADLGDALLGPYVLPFELASVVLLAALLGGVTLARGWKDSGGKA
jgi:NADH-quinone oxidoreductase subunit J